MEKKPHKYLLYILSYLYIFIGYSYIIYYISYSIRIANKPEGWALMLFFASLCFIAYSTINHILIRKIISNKLLIIIEALLFVAMLTLVISDFKYEDYRHLEYLQRTKSVTVTPWDAINALAHLVKDFEEEIVMYRLGSLTICKFIAHSIRRSVCKFT